MTAEDMRKHRKRKHLLGGQVLHDPGEAIAHVQHLRDLGMGLRPIAHQSGVDLRQLLRLLRGDTRSISRETRDGLLSVQPALAPGLNVPARGTHRRLQALGWLGYSWRELDRQRGLQRGATANLLYQDQVTVRVAVEVRELFERLLREPLPSGQGATRARNHARQAGWASPWAWDHIDNPRERPKGMAA